jgi:hypothetical protein
LAIAGQVLPTHEDEKKKGAHCGLPWYNASYTNSMKTAVSLPDELFRKAEAAARRLRVSRSHLYAKAIEEFLDRQRDLKVTERLNEVYSRESSKLDPAFDDARLNMFEKNSW